MEGGESQIIPPNPELSSQDVAQLLSKISQLEEENQRLKLQNESLVRKTDLERQKRQLLEQCKLIPLNKETLHSEVEKVLKPFSVQAR